MARYDLGISSWDELADLTPSMFRALCLRRNVRLKHERLAAAEVAAAVYNVNRNSKEDRLLTGWDFVRDGEQAEKYAAWMDAKQYVRKVLANVPYDAPRSLLMKIRGEAISELTRRGRTDAAELWAEAWPSVVPQEGDECQ